MKKKLSKVPAKKSSKGKEVAVVNQIDTTALQVIDVNPQSLIMAAIDKGVSIDVMEKLLAMRERLWAESAEREYREAMAQFQSECKTIVKSAGVDYPTSKGRVQYRYAPLDVIVDNVKNPLRNNGLSYTFTTEQTADSVTAICHAHHIAGHSESTRLTIPIDGESRMNPAQKTASALTYAKRYAFCNAFGILTGDEDNDAITHTSKIADVIQPEIIPMTIEEACAKMRSTEKAPDGTRMRALVNVGNEIAKAAAWNTDDKSTLNSIYVELEAKFKADKNVR